MRASLLTEADALANEIGDERTPGEVAGSHEYPLEDDADDRGRSPVQREPGRRTVGDPAEDERHPDLHHLVHLLLLGVADLCA